MLYQLSYTRGNPWDGLCRAYPVQRNGHGGGRIRTYVGIRRQIYSLLPLATRAPHPLPAICANRSQQQHPGGTRRLSRVIVYPQAGTPARRHGADEGTRTPNLLITNQLLYQLSYVSRALRFATIL